MKKYLIKEKSTSDYWNNAYGFGDKSTADVFNEQDKQSLNLPIGGEWVEYTPQKAEWTCHYIEPKMRHRSECQRFEILCNSMVIADILKYETDANTEANAKLIASAPQLKADNERLLKHNLELMRNNVELLMQQAEDTQLLQLALAKTVQPLEAANKELIEALKEITEMANKWSVKGLTPTIFKAEQAIQKHSK